MAKPEWGNKRICQSCGAPFYDLQRDPIVCPKCSAVFDLESVLKSRRPRGQPADSAAKAKEKKEEPAAEETPADQPEKPEKEPEAAAEKPGADADADGDAPEDDAPKGEGDVPAAAADDDSVPEDASDLGDDDDDVAEVVDVEKKEEET